MQPEKYYYTYDQFNEDCDKIASWAREKHINSVYGVPRGGLAVALRLSHLLDVPLLLSKEDITPRTLILDDLADKGDVLTGLFASLGKRFLVATLFVHKDSKIKPDFYVREKTIWIQFPWETDQTSRYDGTMA